jgi:outer membrane lipoprotein carrier protein
VFILASVPGATAESGSQRLHTFFDDTHSLQADFEQTLFDENLSALEDSRGKMYLERPGKFRWDYSAPYPQEIVSDGEKVWIYDSELAQVTVKALGDTLGDTPALLLTSERPLDESFDIKDLDADDGLAWVELVPKSPDATFASVRLGFDGDELRVMALVDSFGQTTKITFAEIVKNPNFNHEIFTFSAPDGVDVLGDDEL